MIEPVDLVDDGLNSGIVGMRSANDIAGALASPNLSDVEICDSLPGTPRHDLARPMLIRPSCSLAGGFGEIEYGIHSQKFVRHDRSAAFFRVPGKLGRIDSAAAVEQIHVDVDVFIIEKFSADLGTV